MAAFLQGSLHEEIWLRRPPGFTETFPAGTQWSLRRPVYGLRLAPREWHDTLRTTLAALGFTPSTADPYLGLQITRDRARRTITQTQSHMVRQVLQRFGFQFSSPQPTPLSTCHSLSAPPSDESVKLSGPYPELVGCLMYLMTCTRPDLAYPLSLLARYVAPNRHRKVHWALGLCLEDGVHLGSKSVSWRSTRSSSVLNSNCEVEIYAGSMAAQELRWLTYLLTDMGEQPRSPPVLYVDNKAMIALCQEHRLEHRTKLIARELQQRGQLRLAFVATRANTADIFIVALLPGIHFYTMHPALNAAASLEPIPPYSSTMHMACSSIQSLHTLSDPPVLCRAPPHHFDGGSAQSSLRFLLRPLSCPPVEQASVQRPRAVPCVFLGFPPDAPGWQFYHPTSRCVLSSQDVTFDESVPYYHLFPYRTAPLPPPPLFLARGPPPVDPLPPQGPAPSGVSQVDAVEPVEVAVDSGAARDAEPVGAGSGGAESGGAEPRGAECGGAEPGGAEHGGAQPGGAEPGGAEPGGAESARVASRSALSRRELLSPQELREWFARRWSRAAGALGPPVTPGPGGARTNGTRAVGTGGAAAAAGVGPAGASGATGAGAAGGVGADVGAAGASGAAGAGAAGGVGAGVGPAGAGGAAGTGAATGGTGAVPVGTGDPARPRPYFVLLLEQVLGLPPSPGPAPPLECPQRVQSQSPLQPVSPLPASSPYAGPTGGLDERREPASRPALPVRTTRTSRCAPRPRPSAVPGTHQMTLRPCTAPLRVPLPSPPASSLPVLADPVSDSLCAASPTIARLLSTVVTYPSFESTSASALVAELVDFAARCRLDYAASLVAESASVCPPSVGGECALSTDVLEDRQEEFQCFAAALPNLVSTLIAPEGDPDAPDIPTPRSYAEAIEGPSSSQWQVKRPPGSPPVFKARYVARGFSQRQGVDYFQAFSPTPKMTTLRVLLHVATQRDYALHSLDFSTAFLQGSLHEEIWLRRPPGFTGSFPRGTRWSLRRPVYGLRQAPREWHDTLRTTLAALGFAPSTADPSLFLRTDTSLPPFYILVYVNDLVFATADTAGLAHVKSKLQKRHTCTDLGELRSYLGLQITRNRAQRTITLTQSHMVQQVLQRFNFTYSSPQATPLSTRHSLSALPSDESVEPSGPDPELVGCLMYLMTCTRPDLAYPLSILARYVAPGRHRPEHMAAAKRVLRYLCSTLGLGLVLGGRRPVVLTGHADASWADDQATQRSSQGYTFSLGSGYVSWRSTRSSSVLSSSFEAEIYAGAMAAQELRWLTYLLTDLGEPPRSPPVLYVDNKAMLALSREHRLEHRTKHIALRYFLAR
ncbi:unnamed protein product [Closterium sp. NIES-54]